MFWFFGKAVEEREEGLPMEKYETKHPIAHGGAWQSQRIGLFQRTSWIADAPR
jgi:hypothetical protein